MFTNMEAKLAEYRAKKAKEKQFENSLISKLKNNLTHRFRWKEVKDLTPEPSNISLEHSDKQAQLESKKSKFKLEDVDDIVSVAELSKRTSTTEWLLRILKFLLWLTLWGLFVELQFGAVFFTISVLLFIYVNTRTGPKDNRPSAYSVFNKDCERIHGTLTAEQLQKQMFSVPGLPA
ncbi:uncharacterized protein LOC131941758 [Physella acuta]|uniref:uncharacterized protein LOC131941758 n=1 Tax=Physella acuta TaxID=109671 RepID=UPI0027DD7A4F|nr:uncharacterized protein LOC131941758 [Physella acuta]